MTPSQAARIRGQLSARFPGNDVEVILDRDGARVILGREDDAFHVRITTGDQPGTVLWALLGRDLRLVDDEASA